ncbi:ribose-phosphate pyrophosphokinase [Legionella oakridgensis]|uniref:Ribose-phosphate pyrophosphokinase n=2 Tax=Legionella oakridgensis TaxID=29423 RepID=W0BCH2_9GAMM|nr:ribose-phosphate pyrophosphokinase [Legionella oakridgensis]AHE66119.1 ribose-phosphate pyrophosphokinase [Legionella oakridgensis ATCC 33761 = DSM 21215]ETO94181.1 ribose-phosphate pyrophosphokinase [Legionella oakridgensis RV-2-2007]KTD43866.1 ribose-phosphate pyrophosphokinase [Legionella oakridgensis]STY16034.1 ribose-phosphate pyrophosphokinase [Legionella longbeachae]
MSTMMIFTGNANPELAYKISSHLNLPIGQANVGTFSDGETMVEILENVRGKDVFIIQSTCAPANNNLMELLVIADALRRSSASRITAVVPYFGYARQDRRVRSARVPITAKVVADMMTSVGISRVLTVDLHADQIQGFFYMPVDNVYSTPILLEDIKQKNLSNLMVISPDVGGVVRARAMAKRLNDAELTIIDKRRSGPNKSEVMHIIGEPKGRHCLIIDDIVDTAGTLCSAAQELKNSGAISVRAYVTHPVLSGPAINNINHSALDEIVVTDTIPLSEPAKNCPKIRVVSLAEMLAQAIKRVNEEESVSSMFAE